MSEILQGYNPILEWAKQNVDTIQFQFETQRQIVLNNKNFPKQLFNSSLFTLSEMPLCPVLYKIVAPKGYSIICNRPRFPVSYEDKEGAKENIFHYYFQSQDCDSLICLSFGQFIKLKGKNIKPGDRIIRAKQDAPGLVFQIDNQIAILSGTFKEVEDKLGISYR